MKIVWILVIGCCLSIQLQSKAQKEIKNTEQKQQEKQKENGQKPGQEEDKAMGSAKKSAENNKGNQSEDKKQEQKNKKKEDKKKKEDDEKDKQKKGQSLCETGEKQSPVNIKDPDMVQRVSLLLNRLQFCYQLRKWERLHVQSFQVHSGQTCLGVFLGNGRL